MKTIKFRNEAFEKYEVALEKPTCRDISDFAAYVIDKQVDILNTLLAAEKNFPADKRITLQFNLASRKMSSGIDEVFSAVQNPQYAQEFVEKLAKKTNTDLKGLDLEPQDYVIIAIKLIEGDYVSPPQAKTEEDEKK
jgi:hypothetical protein